MSCANATLGFSSSKAASILGRLAATPRGMGGDGWMNEPMQPELVHLSGL